MILERATRSIVLKLGEAKTTNDCHVTCAFEDYFNTQVVPVEELLYSNGTSEVEIVPAPPASPLTARSVKEITIFNADTVTHKIYPSIKEGSNLYTLVGFELAAGETLQYSQGYGWFKVV